MTISTIQNRSLPFFDAQNTQELDGYHSAQTAPPKCQSSEQYLSADDKDTGEEKLIQQIKQLVMLFMQLMIQLLSKASGKKDGSANCRRPGGHRPFAGSPPAHRPSPAGGPGGTNTYDGIINRASRKYGVSPNLIKAVIQQESAWKPDAVSPADARGLMQIKPGTAATMGAAGADLFDPATNIDLGTRYLRKMYERAGGNEAKALFYYNAGPNANPNTVPSGQNITGEEYARQVLAKA